ncbi:MAG: hypothetical protein ACI4KM_04515 [Oscillospiraceae bacterium]
MSGLKYLYKRSFSRWGITLAGGCLSAAFIVLVMLFHEELGTEDYLVCKMFLIYGTFLYSMMTEIFLNVDLTGGRCMRASSIARELYTVSVPLYGVITALATLIVPFSAYSVYIAVTGRDIVNISDALITAAGLVFLVIVMCPFTICLRWGFFAAIYGNMLPFLVPLLAFSQNLKSHGFGLPLWAACLILAGAVAVSAAIAFISAHLLYFKADFKPAYQSVINGGK